MKILLANYKSYPRASGVASYLYNLSNKLSSLGHEVDIVAHKPGMNEIFLGMTTLEKEPIRRELENLLTKMYNTKFPHFTKWMIWRELEVYTFQEVVRKINLDKYDIIHTQDIISTRVFHKIKSPHIPLVTTFHNCKTREWFSNGEHERKTETELHYIASEELFSARSADHVILPCHWLRNEFNNLGEINSEITILPYGIDDSTYTSLSEAHVLTPTSDNRPVISCPARLVPIKGHSYLLHALKDLKDTGHSFVCWIIGDGMFMDYLMKEVNSLDLTNEVLFLGKRDDVPALLSASDIVVLSSIHDTLPFSVMEGQMAGKPVVATNVGGIPDMIEHEVTGFLVKPGDSEPLTTYLSQLLHSAKLREEIGAAARQWAEKTWLLDRMVDKTVEIYEHTMKNIASEQIKHQGIDIIDMAFLSALEATHTPQGSILSSIQNGNIKGIVVDAAHHGIEQASVHLIDHSNILLITTRTDIEGNFSFNDIPNGKYSIMAYKENFLPNSLNVNLIDNSIDNLSIILSS
ncbi:glycosyltransferase [Bacillus sp. CECT 9360]|uniref:glycosyltransferase n=1 Tax=Bacillus sp. CECT 9360 TaxID=2845821 RepID=UPI001E2D666E|nr:glycosyltransferase [Bacillus sp. CECT 9360]CAH0345485.1 D-inositol-3-phosphate glycosyltransferase [Bacillus sp. CECT 9360]